MESLVEQTHNEWTIYVSDDGSTDTTLEILQRYRDRLGKQRVVIFRGPQKGFATNFLTLVQRQEVRGPFFAFCDQDDRWLPDRLELGLRWILTMAENLPALFCSRTRIIDTRGRTLGLSPDFRRQPDFKNALVQSLAGGNTMLFNSEARRLLQSTPLSPPLVSHDWWTYIIVTGCGGRVHFCSRPTVEYRQHGQNLVGSNLGLTDRAVRLGRLVRGTFREWTDRNLTLLCHMEHHLTSSGRHTLALFQGARRHWFIRRGQMLRESGVYRQTSIGSAGLFIAAAFNRL